MAIPAAPGTSPRVCRRDAPPARVDNEVSTVELRTALRNNPDEVARARSLVGAHLQRWGLPDDDGVTCVLVTELVTDALRFGAAPMRLILRQMDFGLRLEIHDSRSAAAMAAGTTWSSVPPDAPDSASGRGTMLVNALATRWGWSEEFGERAVWFELDLYDREVTGQHSVVPASALPEQVGVGAAA
ncbi:MAG: ATP-binding protein [Sporichthyaceae bacterium]